MYFYSNMLSDLPPTATVVYLEPGQRSQDIGLCSLRVQEMWRSMGIGLVRVFYFSEVFAKSNGVWREKTGFAFVYMQ